MGYVDLSSVGYRLPDGRMLFSDVTFRVGEGAKVALVGPNGAGKTTLLRLVAGDTTTSSGTIARGGGLGVMRQFIGMIGDDTTVGQLALSLCSPTLRAAGERVAHAEAAIAAAGAGERAQLKYASALAAWGDVGGYDLEVVFDTVAVATLGKPWNEVRDRPMRTLSGGQQKRFALDLLLRGDDEVLLLDEPDNFLDVPGKLWLERRIRESPKTLLFVSHDRELLANTATAVVAVEGGSAWVHPGTFASWHEARTARHERLDEDRRRWDEEHAKLKDLVRMYQAKARYNSDMATRLQAARTRLAKFEADGPPPIPPKDQNIRMRLDGGRTGKRAVMCEQLELTDLTLPFDFEAWYGDRIAVLGANGTGKSHLLRLLGRGGTDPEGEPLTPLAPVAHEGSARLGARVVPGHFSQTHDRPELVGATLVEILWRGDTRRPSLPRDQAMPALSRYELAAQGDVRFEQLSGGQQARFLILLLELSGATLLLLDEPTDNLDLASAEALEAGLAEFAGTVIAVTHDRWFTRSFSRFLHLAGDGEVREVPEPVWG
ncbi:ABC-F family ATP-binding cassette domain-containing protein [Actinospica sp. MGRD01-02]|uniref:ABC-F family ATP-binding cassette domain-containing protein n=1 Tax=Actinospica acidithermotolerans TaxID=2828514 RepID=A0A941EHS8_9ACTN|nr:ATP-binding cassette domain-containing protein [Actinospica acidithermotolerans]MBR7830935.1 ABC-F family ATP-binding cassette domain-containing protein [Actinospica acidithermotolerans]